MKKSFTIFTFLLLGIFSFSLCSCTREVNPTQKIKELRFNITVNNATSTKAVKSGWENGDKIFVFFSEYLYKEDYVTFTYDATSGTWTGVSSNDLDEQGEDNLGTSGTMYAICYPFGDVIVDDEDDYNFTCIYNSTNPALHGMPVLSYSLTNGTGDPYNIDVEGDIATLSGTLNMSIPDNYVQFYIEKSGSLYDQNDKYRLSVEGVSPVSVTFNFDYEEFQNVEFGSGQPMWGYKYGDGIVFSGMIDDTWANPANNHRMVFFSDGDPAVTKVFSGKTLGSHDAIKLKSPISGNGWSNYMIAPSYTEIGGIKWADWYLGCDAPLDIAHKNNLYFRWGDIVPNGSGYCPSKDAIMNTELSGAFNIYDPARAILGSNWRMPGNSDYSSLLSGSNLSVAEDEGKSFVKFSEKAGEKSVIFLSYSALHDGVGGILFFWTNKSSEYEKARAWELNEAAGGSFQEAATKGKEQIYIIRPIYSE